MRLVVLLALAVLAVQLLQAERAGDSPTPHAQRHTVAAALPQTNDPPGSRRLVPPPAQRDRPAPASSDDDAGISADPGAAPPAAADATPVDPVLAAAPPPGHQPAPTDQLATAPGSGVVAGAGPVRRYLVEVETGTGVDLALFAQAVEAVLSDPHSWIGGGDLAVQRVDTEPVDFRVTLAHPDTVDRHCAGLSTDGRYSCWNGARAMLNLTNWVAGIPDYANDLGGYRRYLINHEVGHALGHDHQDCPAPGAPAPVMMQQTKGIAPCVRNSWPYP